jgi:hypothetical protein
LVARRRGLPTGTFVEGLMALLSDQEVPVPHVEDDLSDRQAKRRRHFSFKPGEDLLQALREELIADDDSKLYDTPSKSSDPSAEGSHGDANVEP